MPARAAFALLASLSFSIAGCQGKSSAPEKEEAEAAGAPEYSGKTLEGDIVKLEDLRGKVVLINVWATWCAPCRKELPELTAIQAKHGGENFTVLGISVDTRRDLKKVHGAVRHYGLQYPMIFDPGGGVIAAFDITGYPTSFILGKDGRIRWRRNGLISPNDAEVERQLADALAAPYELPSPS